MYSIHERTEDDLQSLVPVLIGVMIVIILGVVGISTYKNASRGVSEARAEGHAVNPALPQAEQTLVALEPGDLFILKSEHGGSDTIHIVSKVEDFAMGGKIIIYRSDGVSADRSQRWSKHLAERFVRAIRTTDSDYDVTAGRLLKQGLDKTAQTEK